MKKISVFALFCLSLSSAFSQNVGIGQAAPKSKLDINGGVSIGSSYSGTNPAPANGAIIQGQVGVGTNAPNSSAILDLTSTTQGVLYPRMTTTQRNAISTPALGLTIFNTTTNCLEFYIGGSWQPIACGCSSAPATPGSITGTASLCQGTSSVAYSIAAVTGASTYTWSVPSGASIVSGGSTTNISVNYATTATSGNVSVTAGNSCGTSAAAILAVTVNSLPAITSQPFNSTICASGASNTGNTSFSVVATGSSLTYQWQVNTGTGFSNVTNGGVYGGATTATLSITGASTTYSGYQYQCIVSGACSPSVTSSTATLTVNPVPSITNGATASVCSGSGPAISLTASTPSSFAWTIGTITGSITGSSASSGTTINQTLTNPSNAASGSVAYIVTPTSTTGSCAGSATTITVTVNPTPAVTTASTASICSGAATSISLTASAASSFVWTLGTNTGGITGASASSGTSIVQSLTNPSNSTAGSIVYLVTPTSTVGSCAGSAYSITATVNPTPAVTTANTASLCSGTATSIALTASAASSFAWTLGTNTGAITGATASSGTTIAQTLTNPSSTTAGSIVYNVTPTATTGSCVGAAYPITVTVNAKPANGPIVYSATTIGAAQANLAYSVTALSGASYVWSDVRASGATPPTAPSITSGAGTNAISVTYGGTVGNQTVYTVSVSVTSASGCTVSYSQNITAGGKTPYYCTNGSTVPGGADQTFLTGGQTSLSVELWGAGGGGGTSSGYGSGGSGGFVSGTLTVTPSTSYKVIVGMGGYRGRSSSNSGVMYGGGGATGASQDGGSGGGRSAIQLSSSAVDLVTAGGGGGGGGYSNAGCGGAGGANTGGTGGNGNTTALGAAGGTQAAGGAGACESGNYCGVTGTQYVGGNGGSCSCSNDGGGGGGGYYGGGGGAGDHGGGGGGGSNYVSNAAFSSTTNSAGNTNTAGGVAAAVSNTDYTTYKTNPNSTPNTTASVGGAPNSSDGGPGLVVIAW